MRKISLGALALLAAGSVHAQLTILSDNRSVSVSGWVEDASGNVTQSYSQSRNPSSSFAPFAGNVVGSANGLFNNNTLSSGSSATQNSSVTSSQLSFSASVGTSLSHPAPPGYVYSSAYSLFAVSFSVAGATQFSLTDNQHNWDMLDVGESFTLSSAGNNLILGPQIDSNGSEVDQYSGLLEPGQIYTLQISLGSQDYLQPGVTQNFDVALNTPEIVAAPEPSSNLLLGTGAVLAGLLALRRKRICPAR